MLDIRETYPQFFIDPDDNNVNSESITISLKDAVSDVLGTEAFDDDETFEDFTDTIITAFWTMYPSYKAFLVRNESKSTRKKVIKEKAKNGVIECDRCKKKLGINEVEIHHKIPISMGGTNESDNLMCLCHECHKIENYKMLGIHKDKYGDLD